MKLNEYYKNKSEAELTAIAKEAKTNTKNLEQIFKYRGAVSTKLAIAISKATGGELKAYDLKPELKELISNPLS